MSRMSDIGRRRWIKVVEMVSVLALGAIVARVAGAQTVSTESAPADVKSSEEAYQTFYLTNLTGPNEANDAATDLRNMLPKAHLYYDATEGAISMRGSAEDIALARKILADLDRARRVYQLTYTITEKDEGKAIGTQHIAMIVAAGGSKAEGQNGG